MKRPILLLLALGVVLATSGCATMGVRAWERDVLALAEPDSPMVDQLTELQGYTTFDIDATADAWAFFEQHTLTTG